MGNYCNFFKRTVILVTAMVLTLINSAFNAHVSVFVFNNTKIPFESFIIKHSLNQKYYVQKTI